MGIYDRDYYRTTQPAPGYSQFRPRSVVVTLIVVNVAVWIVDAFTPETIAHTPVGNVPVGHWLSDHLAVHVDTLTRPWLWWQYLTYGFTHSPLQFGHILGNMLVLFFLGRDIENHYGPKEFLRLYLTMVVIAGVVWNGAEKFSGSAPSGMYGASGAISGIVVLYAFNFPHRQLLLYFLIPIPAWLLGAIFILGDMFGFFGVSADTNVAFSAHLAGAAFAFVYYWQSWNFGRLAGGRFDWLWNALRRRPRLKVHRPERDEEEDMSQEVDRVLEKISRQGEASLTAKERRILENASREYQRRGRGGK